MLGLLLAAAVGAAPLALDDVQHLTLDVDADGVCPERPVKLTVSAQAKNPTNLLAFQASWDPATLRLEDMQRALPFARCPFSVFKAQPVADPAACALPISCLHEIALSTAGALKAKVFAGAPLSGCSLNPLQTGRYGWLVADGVKAAVAAGRCPRVASHADGAAWRTDGYRGCLRYVQAILEHPSSPYTQGLPRARVMQVLGTIRDCTRTHEMNGASFACGSFSLQDTLVPASSPAALTVYLRAPPTVAPGTTAVGVTINPRLVGEGLRFATSGLSHPLQASAVCPAPVCAAGQRSTQLDGAWCGAGALRSCCADCAAGSHSPAAGSNACTPCPAGHFAPTARSLACLAHRQPCGAGTYESSPATATSDRICTTCDVNCAAGTHHAGCADRSAGACVACPAGRFKAARSLFQCAFHAAPCATGTFEDVSPGVAADRRCAACPAGTYQNQPGQLACAAVTPACAAGTYETVAPTPSSDRVCSACDGACPAGQNLFGCGGARAGGCVACARGQFKATAGEGACVPHAKLCTGGTHVVGAPTATSDRVCSGCHAHCPAGKYHFGCTAVSVGSCVTCKAGTYKRTAGTHACGDHASCPAGLFASMRGTSTANSVCTSCATVCPAGHVHRRCGGIDAGACVPCATGRFKAVAGAAECVAHAAPCAAGSFIARAPSASSERVCAECPAGKHQMHANQPACDDVDTQSLMLAQPINEAVCSNQPLPFRVTSFQSDGRPTDMLAFRVAWDAADFELEDVRRTPQLAGLCDGVSRMVAIPAPSAEACALTDACIAELATALANHTDRLAAASGDRCTLGEGRRAGRKRGWALQDAVAGAAAAQVSCPMPVGAASAQTAWLHKSYRACYPMLGELLDRPGNAYMPDAAKVERVKPCLLHHQSEAVGFACASKSGAKIIPAELSNVLEIDLRAAFALEERRNSTLSAVMDPGMAGNGYAVRNPSILAMVRTEARCAAPRCEAGTFATRSDGLWCDRAAGNCCSACPAGKYSAVGAALCTGCAAGRFQTLRGGSACRPQRGPCGDGSFEKQAPTALHDRICEGNNARCPIGMHHLGGGNLSASTCVACPTGQYKVSADTFHCTVGNVETLVMRLDSYDVCPGKPIKLGVTAATSHRQPVDMLAFQTYWDPEVLMVEDTQRNATVEGAQCKVSMFKTQKVVDWEACSLPDACLHGIASNIGRELYSRMYEHGEKTNMQCTLSSAGGADFGWVLRKAIAPLIDALNYDGSGGDRSMWVDYEPAHTGESNRSNPLYQSPHKLPSGLATTKAKLRCPAIPHATPDTAWSSPTMRACYGAIEQILETDGIPYMKHLPKYESAQALRLIKPCMAHHASSAVAFACGSGSGEAVVPATVPGAVEISFRAPPVLRAAGRTAVGLLANENLSPKGIAYAPARDVQHLTVSSSCPAPVCAAGQRSVQEGGAWCGAGAEKPCCQDCNPGEYSPFEGGNKCLACPAGQFQDGAAQIFCKAVTAPCEVGSYEFAPPTATSDRVCATCDVNCPAGTHHTGCADRSAGACTACPAGRFKATRSMFQCAFHSGGCPEGTYTVSGTERADSVCKVCPGGAATCASPKMQRLALATAPESDASTPIEACPNRPVSLKVTSIQSDSSLTDMLAFELSWDVTQFTLVEARRTPALSGKCDVSILKVLPAANADACELSTACVASLALAVSGAATRLGGLTKDTCSLSPAQKPGFEYGWALGEAVRDAVAKEGRCPLPAGVAAVDAWQHKSFRACYPTLEKLIDHPRNPFMPDPKLVARVKPCLLHHQSTGIGFACFSKTGAPVIPARLQDVLEVDLRSSFALENGNGTISITMDPRLAGVGYSVLAEAASARALIADQCPAPKCAAGQYAKTAYGLWCEDLKGGCCGACPAGKYKSDVAAATCTACPVGRYQHLPGATACAAVREPCAVWNGRGSFEAYAATSSSDRECKGCNSNCRPGTHHIGCGERNAGSCVACPSGHYKAVWGMYHCKPIPRHTCVAGKYRSFDIYDAHGGAIDQNGVDAPVTGCISCPKGKYTGEQDQSECKSQSCCSAGRFMHAPSAAAEGVCTTCPNGKYIATVRSQHCAGAECRDQPSTCPPRMQLEGASATQLGTCRYCPAASFKPTADGAQCTQCPAGRYGRLSMRGMQDLHEACFACPAGQYQEKEGQSSCTACDSYGTFFDSSLAVEHGAGGSSAAYCKTCTTTAWSAYGQCSKACGIGRQTRTRALAGAAAGHADAQAQCDAALTSERVCNTHGCKNAECYHVKCRFSHDASGHTVMQVLHHHKEPNIVHHCRVNELGTGAKSCSCVCNSKNAVLWMPAPAHSSDLLKRQMGELARRSVPYSTMPLLKCGLPDACIHGIARAIGDRLYQRAIKDGEDGECSLSSANATGQYGWVIDAAVASQFAVRNGTSHCSAIVGTSPSAAWRSGAVRGCLRFASFLLQRPGNEYTTALGSNAPSALKRLLPCIESTPRSTGDWMVGTVSRNSFARGDSTYGVGLSVDVIDESGRAIVGLHHGSQAPQEFSNVSHAFLIDRDTISVLEGGAIAPGSRRIARWDSAKHSLLASHLAVRVNHKDKVEYVVDGHVMYTSAAPVAYPLRVAGALYNSAAQLRDVTWLDRRTQARAPATASLAASNSDVVWDTLPGNAPRLSQHAEDQFKAVWDANVAGDSNVEVPL